MKIVIDIPEYVYEIIKKCGSGAPKSIDDAIVNGTQLPKGHGDLIARNYMGKTTIDDCKGAIKLLEQEPILDKIRAKIDKLPRIKIGNSNSPTVKYCIDEVLIYDLLENYKAEKTAEWISKDITDFVYCSKCDYREWYTYAIDYNYCPNCGCRMKKESEEDTDQKSLEEWTAGEEKRWESEEK